jgi:hypothetical protein
MVEIVETRKVAERSDALWREIGEFGAVGDWHPMVEEVESEGEKEGCRRTAETRDGSQQTDLLLENAPEQHFYRYRILSTEMLVEDYVGELRVEDNGDGTSTVAWSAEFQIAGAGHPDPVDKVRAFINAGLDNLVNLHAQSRA